MIFKIILLASLLTTLCISTANSNERIEDSLQQDGGKPYNINSGVLTSVKQLNS